MASPVPEAGRRATAACDRELAASCGGQSWRHRGHCCERCSKVGSALAHGGSCRGVLPVQGPARVPRRNDCAADLWPSVLPRLRLGLGQKSPQGLRALRLPCSPLPKHRLLPVDASRRGAFSPEAYRPSPSCGSKRRACGRVCSRAMGDALARAAPAHRRLSGTGAAVAPPLPSRCPVAACSGASRCAIAARSGATGFFAAFDGARVVADCSRTGCGCLSVPGGVAGWSFYVRSLSTSCRRAEHAGRG